VIIYMITNTVNGKRYVGMTCMPLVRRWRGHKDLARPGSKSRTAISNAIRKYGKGTFKIEHIASLLPHLTRKDLEETERQVIAQEGTFGHGGYNMTPGGDGVPPGTPCAMKGKKLPPEHVAKLVASWNDARKAAHIERYKDPEFRKKAKAGPFSPKAWLYFSNMCKERNARMNGTPEHMAKVMAGWTPEKRRLAGISQVRSAILRRHGSLIWETPVIQEVSCA
jgi:group I intron endonuclease